MTKKLYPLFAPLAILLGVIIVAVVNRPTSTYVNAPYVWNPNGTIIGEIPPWGKVITYYDDSTRLAWRATLMPNGPSEYKILTDIPLGGGKYKEIVKCHGFKLVLPIYDGLDWTCTPDEFVVEDEGSTLSLAAERLQQFTLEGTPWSAFYYNINWDGAEPRCYYDNLLLGSSGTAVEKEGELAVCGWNSIRLEFGY